MAEFSLDKQALQNTLAILDTNNKVEDVVGYSPKYETHQSTDTWFLRTMMEVCCIFLEPDPDKRELLYKEFEKELVRKKILNRKIKLENLTVFRINYAKQVIRQLVKIQSRVISSPKDPKFITKLFRDHHLQKYSNAYEDNFKELQEIGKGGFGRVYKVRHKVDRRVYAVKKIIFNFEREKDYSEVMSEVKSISRLNNKNIVSYKNCWIQHPSTLDEEKFAEDGSDNLDSEKSTVNQKNNPKHATILDFATDASSFPRHSISKTYDGNLGEKSLNFDCNKRLSISFDTDADNWSNSACDQTISESENDQSIICDNIPNDMDQSTIAARLNFSNNESILNSSTISETSWMSTPDSNRTLELETDNFQSAFFRNPAFSIVSDSNSSCNGLDNSPPDGDSSHDRSPPESEDFEITFSDSCREDSTYNLVFQSDDLNATLNELDDTIAWENDADSEHDETSDEHESVQNAVSCNSLGNDLTSEETSILVGDFSKKVSISRCKTSHMTSWSSSSPFSRTSIGLNDSNICLGSIKRASSPYFPFEFKPKNRAMLCIQMEYCDCDLKQWLEQRSLGKPLPFQKDIKHIFKEIVKGVSYIHSKSIIHRDLKPANIFYSKKDDSMKIGDFGLATLCHSSPRQHKSGKFQHFTSKLGTAPYAAPEQMQKNSYNNKVDIYSLGIILFELLCLFRTSSELYREIEKSRMGDLSEELTSQHPSYIELFQNLTQKEASLRMPAKEILNLPTFQDDAEIDKTLLMQEIKDLKEALELKDQEFQKALELKDQEFQKALELKDQKCEQILREKDATIENLHREIRELSSVVQNLKSKKGRKKH